METILFKINGPKLISKRWIYIFPYHENISSCKMKNLFYQDLKRLFFFFLIGNNFLQIMLFLHSSNILRSFFFSFFFFFILSKLFIYLHLGLYVCYWVCRPPNSLGVWWDLAQSKIKMNINNLFYIYRKIKKDKVWL